jgi:quinol monooxygenase YgiN
MGKFLKAVPPTMTTGLDLAHYRSVGGFLDLPGDKCECEIMQDTRIVCKSADARKSVLERLQKLTKTIQASEEKKSSGVLTYMAFESLDNDIAVRLYGRYATRDSMESFLRRSDVLNFWMQSKNDVATMESRGYLPNGKGWLHR